MQTHVQSLLEVALKKILILVPLALSALFCALTTTATPAPTPDIRGAVNATLTAIAAEVTNTSAPLPVPPTASALGNVSGRLQYPADALPPMRIFAFQVGTDAYYSIETSKGQNEYQITGLPEGKYHIVAYTIGGEGFPANLAGAYTQAVLCGMQETCSDHNLVDVIVIGGQTITDVNIFDWLQPDFPTQPPASTP